MYKGLTAQLTRSFAHESYIYLHNLSQIAQKKGGYITLALHLSSKLLVTYHTINEGMAMDATDADAEHKAFGSRTEETNKGIVLSELQRVMNDRRFSAAPQMSSFLSYIVHQTLDGNSDRIKAYSVGVDALGKPPTFDAQSDPSVRVLALRLRKALADFYDCAQEPLTVIELKVGTYVPTFLQVPADVESDLPES